jgi:hypothetical protein
MILSESEYRDALRRVEGEKRSLVEHEAMLRNLGYSDDRVDRKMASLRCSHRAFVEEVKDAGKALREVASDGQSQDR